MRTFVKLPRQVTLHNHALVHMDSDPTGGFKKLNFLLQSPPFPPETFPNLLLLYCKPQHAFYDLAADVIAESPHYVNRLLSKVPALPDMDESFCRVVPVRSVLWLVCNRQGCSEVDICWYTELSVQRIEVANAHSGSL